MAVIYIRNWPGAVAGHAIIKERCADYGLSQQEAACKRGAFARALIEGRSTGYAIQAGNRGLRAYTVHGGAA
jgi:hypothetical protein